MLSSLLRCSVISLLSSRPHAFAPKELFSSTDLLSTSFDGPPLRGLHSLSLLLPLPPLPPSFLTVFAFPHHRPPRLPSLTTPVYSVAQRGWLSLMNSLFSL